MSEADVGTAQPNGRTAGRLLREARQAQGLHIAALASAIKVTPHKLELLESDRYDELPDATFTRALAQTVCRSLKIDAGPILALLPPSGGHRLDPIGEGLNTPYRDRPQSLAPTEWASVARPAIWAPALLLLAAVAVYLAPPSWLTLPSLRTAPAPGPVAADTPSPQSLLGVSAMRAAASAATAPAQTAAASAAVAAPAATGEVGAASPAGSGDVGSAAAANDASPVPDAEAGPETTPKLLQLRATADTWIELVDGHGQSLLSRLVKAGEVVDLDGATPMRLKIGNASGTEVVFRGQSLELAPFTRDNLARLELK